MKTKDETWVEDWAYENKVRLISVFEGEDARQTQTMVNGRWLVRWWKRVR